MPYIKHHQRLELSSLVDEIHMNPPRTGGEINYLITLIGKVYLENKGECYDTYEDIIGAMEIAKLEFFVSRTAPYESKKKYENGDV